MSIITSFLEELKAIVSSVTDLELANLIINTCGRKLPVTCYYKHASLEDKISKYNMSWMSISWTGPGSKKGKLAAAAAAAAGGGGAGGKNSTLKKNGYFQCMFFSADEKKYLTQNQLAKKWKMSLPEDQRKSLATTSAWKDIQIPAVSKPDRLITLGEILPLDIRKLERKYVLQWLASQYSWSMMKQNPDLLYFAPALPTSPVTPTAIQSPGPSGSPTAVQSMDWFDPTTCTVQTGVSSDPGALPMVPVHSNHDRTIGGTIDTLNVASTETKQDANLFVPPFPMETTLIQEEHQTFNVYTGNTATMRREYTAYGTPAAQPAVQQQQTIAQSAAQLLDNKANGPSYGQQDFTVLRDQSPRAHASSMTFDECAPTVFRTSPDLSFLNSLSLSDIGMGQQQMPNTVAR